MTDHEVQTQIATAHQTRIDAESKLLEIGRQANALESLHDPLRKIGAAAGAGKLWPAFLELAMDDIHTAKTILALGVNAMVRAQTVAHCDRLAMLTAPRN
jgi:hypothetical protein